MANCTRCGAELKSGIKFCTECGAAVPETRTEGVAFAKERKAELPTADNQQPVQQTVYQQPINTQPAPPRAQPITEQAPGPGSPYGLISTGGYIGIMLLLCIPIIGLILMIVWACGGCRKHQKRNMARAMLIMTVIMLVIGLVIGLVFRGVIVSVFDTLKDQAPEAVSREDEGEQDALSSLFGGLFGGGDTYEGDEDAENADDIYGLFSGLFGGDSSYDDSTDDGSTDDIYGLLAGLMGEDLSGIMNEVEDINSEASENSDGWPSDLPDYPDGTMEQVENYRTLITGTSDQTMWSYVETLKGKGYEFQDFYGFGMSEEDMKYMNAWWGTNGKWYLSISYADGTVTIDHTTELPDLSGLFG